jgi:hypothetical protein
VTLRVGYPVEISVVVVVGTHKTKSESLGYCGVLQLRRKMRCRVEVKKYERKMEDTLVVGEKS